MIQFFNGIELNQMKLFYLYLNDLNLHKKRHNFTDVISCVFFLKFVNFGNFSIPVFWNSTCIKDVTLLMDQDCQGKINHKLWFHIHTYSIFDSKSFSIEPK